MCSQLHRGMEDSGNQHNTRMSCGNSNQVKLMTFIMVSSLHNLNKKRRFIPGSHTLIDPVSRAKKNAKCHSSHPIKTEWGFQTSTWPQLLIMPVLMSVTLFLLLWNLPSSSFARIYYVIHLCDMKRGGTQRWKCCSASVRHFAQCDFFLFLRSLMQNTHHLQNRLLFYSLS